MKFLEHLRLSIPLPYINPNLTLVLNPTKSLAADALRYAKMLIVFGSVKLAHAGQVFTHQGDYYTSTTTVLEPDTLGLSCFDKGLPKLERSYSNNNFTVVEASFSLDTSINCTLTEMPPRGKFSDHPYPALSLKACYSFLNLSTDAFNQLFTQQKDLASNFARRQYGYCDDLLFLILARGTSTLAGSVGALCFINKKFPTTTTCKRGFGIFLFGVALSATVTYLDTQSLLYRRPGEDNMAPVLLASCVLNALVGFVATTAVGTLTDKVCSLLWGSPATAPATAPAALYSRMELNV